jgi:uncharacterized protein (DUF2252 family)
MPVKIVDAIRRFNAGRDPERLAMKYRNLRASPSLFLRGACHLFYARLPKHKLFAPGPAAWISGDLHFENFGSYKGANRLIYFDINDFDEALLAPAAWDILRLLASVLVARQALHLKRGQADRLCEEVIDAYGLALATGKAGWMAGPGAATGSVLRQMGQLAAWAQLRSCGRQGSASADELIAFGAARAKWSGDLMRAARLCAEQVDKDWRTWCLAYDRQPAWAASPVGPALKV